MTSDPPSEALLQKVKALATAALDRSEPTSWFEQLYQEAQGDPSQVPWAKLEPHPDIQNWLIAHGLPGQGRSVLVIGCGLGDDAEALHHLGCQVVAFDISPTAIAWCRQRFPQSGVDYQVADLLNPLPAWQQAFDLVVECRNLQALPLTERSRAIHSVGSCVASAGTLLVVTRLRETEAAPDGPPWPLSNRELAEFELLGLQEIRRAFSLMSTEPVVHQGWVEYRRV